MPCKGGEALKKAVRRIFAILLESLPVISALIMLLMALNMIPRNRSDTYIARGGTVQIEELTGVPADWLPNVADADALNEMPGIGDVLAVRIIETRERDGLFYFPEDLMTVKGIGEKRLAGILEYIAQQEATPGDIPIP